MLDLLPWGVKTGIELNNWPTAIYLVFERARVDVVRIELGGLCFCIDCIAGHAKAYDTYQPT